MRASTVILGLGNTLLSDEGAGVFLLSYLEAHHAQPGIRYLDGGTLSFTLAVPIADAERLVVLDAAELCRSPGSIELFEGEAMDEYLGTGKRRSVHEVGLLDLMAAVSLTGRLPRRRALLALQPERVTWGEEPSPAVAEAIPQAAGKVCELLERWERVPA